MQAFNPELQQAIQLHQNGQLEAAESAYKLVLSTQQIQDFSIYSNLADVLNQQGKPNEALTLLKGALDKHPKNPQITIALSQNYVATGNVSKAKKLIQALLTTFPNMGEAHYAMGNIFMQEQQFEKALSSLKKTVQHFPHFAEAYYSIGAVYYQQGKFKQAEENWKKTIQLQADFMPALLNLAHLALEKTLYQEAAGYLEQVLQVDPLHFSAIKMLGMAKHSLGNIDEALQLYESIHNSNAPEEEVLTLIANANRDLDRFSEAENRYQEVLKINPQSAIAKENLEKISGRKIEGWHFDMLSDLRRNEGYYEAIKRVVEENDLVLDIGTGSGLLSMMCAKSGASKVFTCETIEIIANAAKTVIKDNELDDKIEVFHAKSNKLKVGEEIPEKVDLIVSEILDSGLLGEGVLPSLRHAQANLLKEGGRILPQAATVKGMLVQSDHLKSIAPIAEISGFDLSSFGKFQTQNTYRREIIKSIPHLQLSDEFELLPINFYQLPPAASPESPNTTAITVTAKESGIIHAVAFWFDLHLDEKLSLSSGPSGEMVHWGQAVYCFPEPRSVEAGETVTLSVEQSEMKIIFSFTQ